VELPLECFAAVSEELFATLPVRHVMFTGVSTLMEVRRLILPLNIVRSVAADGTGSRPFGWREGWLHTRERRTFTVLGPAPKAMEPALRTGRWRVLCPAVWSGPDRETEGACFQRFRNEPDESTDFGRLQLATRLFNEPTEFERWCPIPNPQAGPHWIELEDGQLVSHQRGLDLPTLYEDQDEFDVYDEDLE
jgi:hypothetical protein